MDRLNAGNVEKLTVSNGKPFQMFMTRSGVHKCKTALTKMVHDVFMDHGVQFPQTTSNIVISDGQ